MYYSIDGKLVKSGEKNNKKIKEDFINIPFFQFTSATNAGLRTTSDIDIDKDANIKGDINLDGKIIKGGEEIDITKLSSEEFNIKNLKVGGTSVLSGKVGVGSPYVNNSLTVVGLDKYTTDGNRLSTHFGYGQFRIYFGSENTVSDESKGNDESKGKYDNRAHLDIGYNIGKIGNNAELGGAYLQTQVDFVGHTPICINPMGGNVGVGTNNPMNKFHVVGDSGLTISTSKKSGGRHSTLRLGLPYTSNHDAYCAKIESYNNHSLNYASDLRFHTHPGPKNYKYADERMRITSNGNVGIGTKSPRGKLEVIGEGGMPIFIRSTAKNKNWNDGHQILSLRNDAITSKDGHGYGKPCLSMDWDIGNNAHWCFGQGGVTGVYGNTSTMGIGYQDKDENIAAAYGWVPKFFFTKEGNLGIGTSNPKQRLDVNGAIRIQQTDKKHNGEGGEIQLAFGNQSKGYRHWHIDVEANNRFRIFKNDAGKVVGGIDITEEGNMSIGGSKANRKLEVAGGLQANSINPFPGNDSGTYYSI